MDGELTDTDAAIRVRDVTKHYGDLPAVDGVSLTIAEGEFFTMLGPSGCGKTTTLRIIGGFERPDRGRIELRGEDVTDVPPNRRNVHMVFQSYALFPHLSVHDNVAFGLKVAGERRSEQRRRVEAALDLVNLDNVGRRRPHQLSGGQQQRVALARALVNSPAALLFDEPLGALDVKLRRQLQGELKRIQIETGTTFVYVTHDQDEAFAMSDRIAVMRDGRVEQLGDARDIYANPATPFVADFVGSLTWVSFTVESQRGDIAIGRPSAHERVVAQSGFDAAVGATIRAAIRPERVRVTARDSAPVPDDVTQLSGIIADIVFLGSTIHYRITTAVGEIAAEQMDDGHRSELDRGAEVYVAWRAEDARIMSEPAVAIAGAV